MKPNRIYLSPPHLEGNESAFVEEAFASNWIAPSGPHIKAFEEAFCKTTGTAYAVALSSGTAAIHLALSLMGIGPGDLVLCPTLTFVATANPILYLGASPIFLDCEEATWGMDPSLLEEALQNQAKKGPLPKAVLIVHLYGQSVNLKAIMAICSCYGIPLIEDAAEALGSTYRDKFVGTLGRLGVFSFNGNKIITTSGGGMLVSEESALIEKARFLATQARDPAPHYQHSAVGYNYRMSNVLAGIGRGQLKVLAKRVKARRSIFEYYSKSLNHLPGVSFLPEPFGQSNRWLSCLTINPAEAGVTAKQIRLALQAENIECRPVWKPLHLQPLFKGCVSYGGKGGERLFQQGLCLPSGSAMTHQELARVVTTICRNF